MQKTVLFGKTAREKLLLGIELLAEAVRTTLGPKGRNAIIDRGFGYPMITNDGVTIAKEIEVKDETENLGAKVIKEVAEKTNELAGDGTTTAVVLAYAIIKKGLTNIAAGANPLAIKRGIDKGVEVVVNYLKTSSKKISTKAEMAQVATISAENEEIGAMIAETVEEVGKDGVITVEDSKTLTTEKEVVKGLQFNKGYISAYMVTNLEKMEGVLEDPCIVITDKRVSSIQDSLKVMETVANSGKSSLLLIAEDVEGEALATFVVNRLKGIFNTIAVKAPGFGAGKKDLLEDIATVVGCKVVSEEAGYKLDTITKDQLGSSRKVIVSKDRTVIVGGKGDKAVLDSRIASIKTIIAKTENKYDKDFLRERLAKLTGGVAVIRVGAQTEVEQIAKQHKTEDALNATLAAVEEGIVPGGGVALAKASALLVNITDDPEEKVGVEILKEALQSPLKQIAENAGVNGDVVVENIAFNNKNAKEGYGFDAKKMKYCDLLEAGIIDPVKVTRSALQNAASAAAMFLTTETTIALHVDKKPEQE